MNDKKLIVIAGPTASGKTKTAIDLAKHFQTEIISADSRQFYREMNIGTAKPSKTELKEVTQHFINSLSIFEEYTAGDFEKDALQKIENLHKNHNHVVMEGGSGLFIDAVVKGFDPMPPKNEELRGQLNNEFKQYGLKPLQEEIRQKDPELYEKIDLANPQRVIRAVEVIRETGKPYSAFRQNQPKKRPFKTIKIAQSPEKREDLYKKINNRVDQMLKKGLFEEAKNLYPYKDYNALHTVGYTEIFDFLDGKNNWEEAVDLIKRNTRRYAKRQITWLKRDPEYFWFDPEMCQNNSILEKINSYS